MGRPAEADTMAMVRRLGAGATRAGAADTCGGIRLTKAGFCGGNFEENGSNNENGSLSRGHNESGVGVEVDCWVTGIENIEDVHQAVVV
jgi:hypothetical protein